MTETLISLVAVVIATSLALYFVARNRSLLRILAAGILLGLGVCVMHYLCMYGMRSAVTSSGRTTSSSFPC